MPSVTLCCSFLYDRQCIGFFWKASSTINAHELYYNIKVVGVSGSKKSPALLRFVGPRLAEAVAPTSLPLLMLFVLTFSDAAPSGIVFLVSDMFPFAAFVVHFSRSLKTFSVPESLSASSSFWRIFLLGIESRLSFWFLLFNSLNILFYCLKICLHHPHFEGYFAG